MRVHVLELRFTIHAGNESILYPVMLECGKELVLVDCGYPGFTSILEDALGIHGFSLRQLTGVIITHHDIDHLGCLSELKELIPGLKVYSSKNDEPYISGKLKSLRLQQAEEMYKLLPDDQREGALYFQETLRKLKSVQVDSTLDDEEELSFCNGIRVVSTPGHMPGHISLYIEESRTLIASDAVVFENGKLQIANPNFTLDLKTAVASVRKLQRLDIDKIICYHGGIVATDLHGMLHKLVDEYANLPEL